MKKRSKITNVLGSFMNGIYIGLVTGSIALSIISPYVNKMSQKTVFEDKKEVINSNDIQYNTNNLESIVGQTFLEQNTNNLSYDYSKIDFSKSYKTENFEDDSDEVMLARLIFGESRGQSEYEKAAVAYTAINRANDGKLYNGETIKEVALAKKQFSAFNQDDVNFKKVKNPQQYEKESWDNCLKVAYDVLHTDKYSNLNQGQTNYFNPNLANPSWKDKMKSVNFDNIGFSFSQDFYIEK